MLRTQFAVPKFGKPAFAGEWERALLIQPGRFVARTEAARYLWNRTEVACEVFFGAASYGLRRCGEPSDLIDFVTFMAAALAESANGVEFFAAVSDGLELPLGQHFSVAQVGAEGAWNSVGPFDIHDPVAGLADFESLWGDLCRSKVGLEEIHDKALEFAFDDGDGTTHWLALPVSTSGTLSRDLLRSALTAFHDGAVADLLGGSDHRRG